MQVNLQEKNTGKLLAAAIESIEASDLILIKQDAEFTFDWNLESKKKIFKLHLVESAKILGLVSVIDIPEEFRIEISLLEVAFTQKGRKKTIDRIAGCLIAYCCWLAFENEYLGFVSLVPKTELIEHYQAKYGFQQYGRQLAVELDQSNLLIQTYLDYGKKPF